MIGEEETENPVFKQCMFWSGATVACPLDCGFYSRYIQESIGHLESHGLIIQDCQSILPFLDEYINAFTTTKDEPALRTSLQSSTLDQSLKAQTTERNAIHKTRACLFCRHSVSDVKILFQHMWTEHSFSIGQIDNLVFVDDLLGELSLVLGKCACIYCECWTIVFC